MTIIQAQPLLAKSTGDVEGPASALDNEVPVFDGITGKKIKAGSGVINPSAGRLDFSEIRAKDGNGLKLYDDGGAGIFVEDGGNVGINQNNPACKLHLTDGSVLFDGTTGDTPANGAGRRMMWVATKNAFRSGRVYGDEWDNANIGTSSFASGTGSKATSWGSFAQGFVGAGSNGLLSSSYGSFVQGYSSYGGTISSTDYGTFAQGFAEGKIIQSAAMGSFAQGLAYWMGDIIASGSGAFAQGHATGDIIASGNGSFAQGADVVSGGQNAVCIGRSLRALGDYCFATGRNMQLSAAANNSFVFGYHSSAIALTQPNTFYIFPGGTAGKVAVGTQTPATSAIMDLTSTIGALLLPRMTTAQRNALTAVNGMVIYSTSNNRMEAYENGAWVDL